MARALSQLLVLMSSCAAGLATSPGELAVAASEASPQHTLHLHLSVDELRQTFSVDRHEDVPEYDLFHVRSVSKRSLDGRHRRSVHVKAFGNEIDLDLEMNREIDNNIRLFYADSVGDDISIERVDGDTDMYVGEPYQDVSREAALLVDHADDDTLQLNGVVADLVLAPAPRRLHHQYAAPNDDDVMLIEEERSDLDVPHEQNNGTGRLRQRRSTPPVTRGLHVIFRRAVTAPGAAGSAPLPHDDALLLEPEPSAADAATGAKAGSRHKRAVNDLYPEVLLIVDYETYMTHSFNAKTLKRYLMSFMNAVDLRYRTVTQPSITIKVAGIVISKSKESTPYLESNMVSSKALNAVRALESIGRYLFTERRLPSYDAVMVITKRDMCTRTTSWGSCNKVTAGYAYVGGGCSISKYHNKINSVALIEDTGGFSGIIVATHELGHLLGSVHDGSPPAAYLGGPGARSCAWKDGYIMSDLRRDHKGLRWSVCSLDQFAHFASDRRSRCMQNYPVERGNLPAVKSLPGKLMSLDAQCKRDRDSTVCFRDQRVCVELYCFEESTGYCVSFRPAAEGSPCGRGMHCIDGRCVASSFYY
ncbi:A disintegrin and metalloproteinase with thrombospondin motifs 18-like [Pollicipes pollicipes]|uniref:A disintegrin and metalloproteinase with thrombospondin motifs 18-like n=1 Tax=Pollicipes pollicipes TaxID=41117 RepID=UPI00188581B1|nr:A disintegrin and metalloproteinase with thrombospondin motifs 18-like [Pollicipes pollicipes]